MSVYYERSELSSVSNGAIYKNYNVCVCVQCRNGRLFALKYFVGVINMLVQLLFSGLN